MFRETESEYIYTNSRGASLYVMQLPSLFHIHA